MSRLTSEDRRKNGIVLTASEDPASNDKATSFTRSNRSTANARVDLNDRQPSGYAKVQKCYNFSQFEIFLV